MKIMDLLQKLIAQEKSERGIGNLAAAEAFAAKAQELLTKHKLDMSEVEFAAEELEEPVLGEQVDASELLGMPDKMRNDQWVWILMSGIAQANFCRALTGKGNRFVVVGRESDRKTTVMLFKYLSDACREMAPKAAQTQAGPISIFGRSSTYKKNVRRAKCSFTSAFKVGFAVAIHKRLERKKEELKAGAQEQGLMRIDQMERAVNVEFKRLFPNTHTAGARGPVNSSGYEAGKAYGAAVGINSTLRLGA